MDVTVYRGNFDEIILNVYSNNANISPFNSNDLLGRGKLEVRTNDFVTLHSVQTIYDLIVDIKLKMDDFNVVHFFHCKLVGHNYDHTIGHSLSNEFIWQYFNKSTREIHSKKPKKSIPNWLKEGF